MASEPEVADQPHMDQASESSRTSFDHHDKIPSLPSQHIVLQTAAPMSVQRRRRRSSASAGLRRSVSTPNVRSTATGNSSMSSADRRGGRNRLGYHRTSIACGHCRRRKIRCLVADDDPPQRCLNCIKQKKECSFLPVDHPPNEERRPRTGSRVEAASGDGSGSSSSSPPIGSVVDQMENLNHFAPLPLSSQEYLPSATTMSPRAHAHLSARPYEYMQHHEQPPWDSPYMDYGPLSAGNSTPEDPSHNYWRSPLTPAFPAQFSGPPTSSSSRDSGGSFTSFAPLSHGLGFPMPPRSMSVHGGQDFHQNYQTHYPPAYETDNRRRASEMMRPSSLQVSRNSSNTSISEASGTPLSLLPNPWPAPQTNWAPLTAAPLAKQPDFWGYLPETGLPQVQEEDVPPPFGSPPAIVYSDAPHP